MRKTRIGKRICVQGVPLDTSWFCPYCCATVDTPLVTLRDTGSTTCTSDRLARLLDYSRPPLPVGGVSGRSHRETCVISVVFPTSSKLNTSRLISSRGFMEKDNGQKPTSGLKPLTPAPATSVRSVVAEGCTGLQIPLRQRVFCSLHCPLLQGIASGLGSN